MQTIIKQTIRLVKYIVHAFIYEGLSFRAASLAYTTLLSLVPLMIIGFSVLSLFPVFHGVGMHLQAFILQHFTTTSADVIVKTVDDFVQHSQYLSVLNIIFLVGVSLLMMYEINRAFNAIWHAERHFHFSLSFLVYFLVLIFSPLCLGGVIVLGAFFVKLPFVAVIIQQSYVQKPLLLVLPYMLIFATFTVFNWVLPSCRVRLTEALVGGLVTTVLFELSKYLFTLYLQQMPVYRIIYGILATVPIFLIWLYVSWTVILIGVIVSHVMAHGIPPKKRMKESI